MDLALLTTDIYLYGCKHLDQMVALVENHSLLCDTRKFRASMWFSGLPSTHEVWRGSSVLKTNKQKHHKKRAGEMLSG